MGERDFVALENMGAGLGFPQAELGAAKNDFPAVVEVALEHLLDIHLLGPAPVQCQEDDAEGGFHGRQFKQFIGDNAGGFAPFELDDDPRIFVGFVAQIARFIDNFLVDQFGDFGDNGRPIGVVGHRRYDQLFATIFEGFDFDDPAIADDAPSRAQVFPDIFVADDGAARREVRSLDEAAEVIQRRARVVDQAAKGVD
jgi:hypothetical protein